MFDNKKSSLIEKPATKATKAAAANITGSATSSIPSNPFLRGALKQSYTTVNPQGSVKLTSTGNDFVDQFGKASTYKAPRSYAEISRDMQLLWSQSPIVTMCLTFYLRMITRVVSLFDGVKTATTQRGQGLKHEGIFRMMWVAINHPDTFWKNINLYIAIGGWKDIIVMLNYDLQYNGWADRKLDWNKMGAVLLAGLENKKTSELVKKYMPTMRTKAKCKTLEAQADNIIAKWLCALLFGEKSEADNYKSYKQYRQLKSSGTAHKWQQLISQHRLLEIDFDSIHGRALAQLVSGKFITKNNLTESYQKWIESKPVAKYTGYIYELLAPVFASANSLKPFQVETVNKQFDGVIATAKNGMKEGENTLMVVVDSSGSMDATVGGTRITAYQVAMSMAVYFAELLKGPFTGHYFEFSNETILRTWRGATVVEKIKNIGYSRIVAGTNFLSVANTFVQQKLQGVAESDFPTGILCVSDGCFNSSGSNKSNTRAFRELLKRGGFSQEYVDNFKIILWDVPNSYYGGKSTSQFEDFADTPNLFHISGLDPAAVAFITGVEGQSAPAPTNSEQLFEAAMNQEVLSLIEI